MGYERHHGIIVTGVCFCSQGQDFDICQVYRRAQEVFRVCTISPLVDGNINYYKSFCVFPDGSKEGWEESDEGARERDSFLEYIQVQNWEDKWVDWVEVQFGDDDLVTEVTRHSDEEYEGLICL